MNHKLIVFGIVTLFSHFVCAQDAIFSQYYANTMALNPAFAGYDVGLGVTTTYRNQWGKAGEGNAAYNSYSVAAQMGMPCNNVGFGAIFTSVLDGASPLLWNRVAGAFHYVIYPKYKYGGASKYAARYPFELRVGASLSYNWRSLNWRNLVFSSQLDPVYGVVPNSQVVAPNNGNLKTSFVDPDVGFLLIFKGYERGNGSRLEQLNIGAAVHHLGINKPPFTLNRNTSLLAGEEYLPMRFTGHFSMAYRIAQGTGTKFYSYFVPIARFDIQAGSSNASAISYRSVNFGGALTYSSVYAGAYLQSRSFFPDNRNISTLVSLFGIEKASKEVTYQLGLSWDYNFGAGGSQLGDAFEICLNVKLNKSPLCKGSETRQTHCPFPFSR